MKNFYNLINFVLALIVAGCGGGGATVDASLKNSSTSNDLAIAIPWVTSNGGVITESICQNAMNAYDCLRLPTKYISTIPTVAPVYGLEGKEPVNSMADAWITSIYISAKTNSYSQNPSLKRFSNYVDWSPSVDGDLLTYVYIPGSGQISLKIATNEVPTNAVFEVSVGDQTIKTKKIDELETYVGDFNIAKYGYSVIRIKAPAYQGGIKVKALKIGGPATYAANEVIANSGVVYASSPALNGVSPYLIHTINVTNVQDVRAMYGELNLQNSAHSGVAYIPIATENVFFGILKKSGNSYKAIFSVAPDDGSNHSVLISKNENIESGIFLNESAGGEVNYIFDAIQIQGFRFFVGVDEKVSGYKDYSAYIYVPNLGKWTYLATLRKSYTDKNPFLMYSLIDNLGVISNETENSAEFINVQVKNSKDVWFKSFGAKLESDEVGILMDRIDYYGEGVNKGFKLSTNGFGSKTTIGFKDILPLNQDVDAPVLTDLPKFSKDSTCLPWDAKARYNSGAVAQYQDRCWTALAWSKAVIPNSNPALWK